MKREENQEWLDLTRAMHKRFKELVDRSGGEDSCWPWLGKVRQDGFGIFYVELEDDWEDPVVTAHSMAWVLFSPMPIKPVPQNKVISLSCGNKLCCNPKHMVFRTRSEISRNGKKTVCKNGHELPEPKVVGGKTIRVCPICNRLRQKEYRDRLMAKNPV
jgi:hypothetical protein